jgi:low affinity Fe/Cu permease
MGPHEEHEHDTTLHDRFRAFAAHISIKAGSPWAFGLAVGTVVVWAGLGPYYHYSDTWQLVINTGTTIITFLMVFLIQNTQNRDAKAIHLKLDELLRGVKGARTELVNLEDLSDEDLEDLQKEFAVLRKRYAERALERRRQRQEPPHEHQRQHQHEHPRHTQKL